MTTTLADAPIALNGTAEDRASRGAKFLDEKVPGWASKIRIEDLDLGDCYQCVLGQIYACELSPDDETSGFYIGSHRLDIVEMEQLIYLGFDRRAIWDDTRDIEVSYDDLSVAWEHEIKSRQS